MDNTRKIAAITHCLVTGGAGFLGSNLTRQLLAKGYSVHVFDLIKPGFEHPNLTYTLGDITKVADVEKAFSHGTTIDTVFHTASIICLMGGKAASTQYRQRAYDINVSGTQNILDCCQRHQTQRLVYTSTNNVVFNGTPAADMNHSTPYATRLYDLYTETKILAEQAVLKANGNANLLTCAIRPAGIYGPESNYMLDTLVSQIKLGRLVATIGDGNAVQDNTYIDNLVHGHILAAEALLEGNAACGKAYFITDDEPMNNFEFFRPIIEGLGYRFPTLRIPRAVVLPFSIVWEYLHFRFGLPEPTLSPKEIDKIAVTHFSNIKDAERDLGYRPVITVAEAMTRCLPYCQQLLQHG